MKKLVLWLLCLLCLCGSAGAFEYAEKAEWITRDGVVYQMGEDCYYPISFRQGQEVLVIPDSVDGLPVYLVERDNGDSMFDAGDLFGVNDARELRIEAAMVDLYALYLSDWPNLARFSLTTPAWDIDYLSISGCPWLADVHTENQGTEDWNTFHIAGCPALTDLSVPSETAELRGSLAGCTSLRTLRVSSWCSPMDDEEPIGPEIPLASIFNLRDEGGEPDGVLYYEDQLVMYPPYRPGEAYAVREGATQIRWGAFDAVQSLRTLQLPASLEKLSDWQDVSRLAAIEVAADNPWLRSIEGVVYSKDGTTLLCFPGQWGTAYETLPGTERIGEAFGGNPMLETLRLSEGLTELNRSALHDMTALREVYLPASLYTLDAQTFSGCTALEAIHVAPDNPHYLSIDGVLYTRAGALVAYPGGRGGRYELPVEATVADTSAFQNASALESLVLPAGVDNLAELSLSNCTSLRRVEVAADHPKYTTIDGVVFSRDGKTLVCYPPGHGAAYDVPPGTEIIGAGAFAGIDTLQAVSFPRSVRVIEERAFLNCTSLTSVVLPLMLEEIGDYAFDSCLSLEKVIIPQGVARVGKGILWSCPELVELQGPADILREYRPEDPPGPQYGLVLAEAGAVLLAEGRSDAAALETLPQGSGCTVLSALAGYAHVEAGALRGWLPQADLALLPWRAWYDADNGYCRPAAGAVVYAAPSTASEMLDTLAGEEVKFLALQGPWCVVETEEWGTGYIETRTLQEAFVWEDEIYYDDEIGMVRRDASLVDFVALQDAPAEEGTEIERLYTGAWVRVVAIDEAEAFVRSASGRYGFLALEDILPVNVY